MAGKNAIESGPRPVWVDGKGVGVVSVTNDMANIKNQLHYRVMVRGFAEEKAEPVYENLILDTNRLGFRRRRSTVEKLVEAAEQSAESAITSPSTQK